ncbi:tripartite motif-containing protein 14 [Amia ocellicauda]|uniref:tripartite motif-containing protein 14 n=1 Tax=Amia ocellicauda TaxID=2972642 RepID=UPI0034644DE1
MSFLSQISRDSKVSRCSEYSQDSQVSMGSEVTRDSQDSQGSEGSQDSQGSQGSTGSKSSAVQCPEHPQEAILYCLNCRRYLCPQCVLEKCHRGHILSDMKKAFNLEKEEIEKKAKLLKSTLRKLGQMEVGVSRAMNDLETKVRTAQENVAKRYKELRTLVDTNEKHAFGLIEAQHQATMQQMRQLIDEGEEFRPSATSVLEITEQMLQKDSKAKLMELLELKDRMETLEIKAERLGRMVRCDTARLDCLESSLEQIVKNTQKFLPRPWEYAKNITFNKDSAHENLRVTADKTQLQYASSPKRVKETQKQSETILASESFDCGKHYWEVDVRDRESWSVGVAYGSKTRKCHDMALGIDRKSWVLQKSDGDFMSMHNGEGILLRERCERLGIFLDCDKGLLTFYSVDKGCSLYCFREKFKKPLVPAFSISYEKDSNWPLTLCTLVPKNAQAAANSDQDSTQSPDSDAVGVVDTVEIESRL